MFTFEAIPLEKNATLHKISLLSLFKLKTKYSPHVSLVINFSLAPLSQNYNSQFLVTVRDLSNSPELINSKFCIKNIVRWRVDLAPYNSFYDYLQNALNQDLKYKYEETQIIFENYGASISLLDGDWSNYAEEAYQLYLKVAQKHGIILYDMNYFKTIAKLKSYKLLCFWYKNALYAMAVIYDEEPTLHGIICGLDYNHSKLTRVYSQMNYEIIRMAIASKKHTAVDVGFTSDKAKALFGYQPVPSCIEISSDSPMMKLFLKCFFRIWTITITENGEVKFNMRFRKKN